MHCKGRSIKLSIASKTLSSMGSRTKNGSSTTRTSPRCTAIRATRRSLRLYQAPVLCHSWGLKDCRGQGAGLSNSLHFVQRGIPMKKTRNSARLTRRTLLKGGAAVALTGVLVPTARAAQPARQSVYEALGLKHVINATGTVTNLGG